MNVAILLCVFYVWRVLLAHEGCSPEGVTLKSNQVKNKIKSIKSIYCNEQTNGSERRRLLQVYMYVLHVLSVYFVRIFKFADMTENISLGVFK